MSFSRRGRGWRETAAVEVIILTGRKFNDIRKIAPKRTEILTFFNLYQVFIRHSNTYMHLEEIAYVSYVNDEFLAVNSLELVYRYKINKASTVAFV